jgi:opacity protein-like surface antigen
MRNQFLVAAALAAIASPAMARDGQPYLGIEGGLLSAKDRSADVFVDFTSTQTPAAPNVAGAVDTRFAGITDVNYKRGYDVDLIGGYDFGFLRVEAELGRKRVKLNSAVDSTFLNTFNTALNRPSAAPDVGFPGQAALVGSDFKFNRQVSINSIMGNALLDFGNDNGFSVYVGAGAGRAFLNSDGLSDSAWAYQGIVGARFAVTSSVDIGLKYRYFRTGTVDLSDRAQLFTGNSNRTVVGTTTVDQTNTAVVFNDFSRKFQSHSLLASLIFNFGAPAVAVVAPPPPAPAPAAPATQTCQDGSVILASDVCPPPPPPAPAPEPAPERG